MPGQNFILANEVLLGVVLVGVLVAGNQDYLGEFPCIIGAECSVCLTRFASVSHALLVP